MPITDAELRAAVPLNTNYSQLARWLGVKGGGSTKILKRRIKDLGIDASHFTLKGIPKRKKHHSFVCKQCKLEVKMKIYDHLRTYCSPECLAVGRPASLKTVYNTEEVKARSRAQAQKSWLPGNRANRDKSLQDLEVQQRRKQAIQLASQQPGLRAKRSANAKRRWDTDLVFRDNMLSAAKKARQQRVLIETCARKPHIPCLTKTQGIVMMRSTWERDFAVWLDLQNLDWAYEPCRFHIQGQPYTPDFLVKSSVGNYYVEIHRTDLITKGDTKFEKLKRVVKETQLVLFHIGELGIKELRKQIRTPEKSLWSIPMVKIE
jgi:hypothetical protein